MIAQSKEKYEHFYEWSHSSVDLSAPNIFAATGSSPKYTIYALSFIDKLELNLCFEKNENKQKEAGLGPFKQIYKHFHSHRHPTHLCLFLYLHSNTPLHTHTLSRSLSQSHKRCNQIYHTQCDQIVE